MDLEGGLRRPPHGFNFWVLQASGPATEGAPELYIGLSRQPEERILNGQHPMGPGLPV
jgi:hypothetical protein